MIHIDYVEIMRLFWIDIIKPFWWFWVLLFGVLAIIPLLEASINKWFDKRWLKKHQRLIDWRKMDSKQFERITAIIFEGKGYKTKAVGGARDNGIDVVASKDNKKFYIQCKRKDSVPPREIREFAGAIRSLDKGKGEKGFFVTTGEYTQEGKDFARSNPIEIELINGFKLEEWAKEIEK